MKAADLRKEAAEFRRMAATADTRTAENLRALAEQYEEDARELDRARSDRPRG